MPRDLGWVEDHVAAPGTIGLLSGATIHQPAYRETRPGRQLPGRWITPMGLQFRPYSELSNSPQDLWQGAFHEKANGGTHRFDRRHV